MAIPHAKSGEVIDIRPLGEALTRSITTTLVKTDRLEIIRYVVPAGKDWHGHQVAGEITVQCLEGRIAFTAGGATHELSAGQMLYLAGTTLVVDVRKMPGSRRWQRGSVLYHLPAASRRGRTGCFRSLNGDQQDAVRTGIALRIVQGEGPLPASNSLAD